MSVMNDRQVRETSSGGRMQKSWRLLALAAALVLVSVGAATAQTVLVRNAAPGVTVEAVVNAVTIGSAVVDRYGLARVAIDLAATVGTAETDVYVYVDECGELRRVLLVQPGAQPAPPGAGCVRRDIPGIFVVRRISTLVVDLGGPRPRLLLRQGTFSLAPPRTWSAAPTGLVLSGGGGLARFSELQTVACGTVTECAGEGFARDLAAAAAFWVTPFLGLEAGYMRPAMATVEGRGEGFGFNSSLDADIVTLAATVGGPVRRARIYGRAGATYHRATLTTTQTFEDRTVTVGEVTGFIEGGTQTYALETAGWGWLFGGGAELWLASVLAFYIEGGRAALKGAARGEAEGVLDDRRTFFVAGARIRLGR
jgi:hypothetical protein